MRGYIVVDGSYSTEIADIARVITTEFMPALGATGTTGWYYDDTEEGIKLDLTEVSAPQAISQMHAIWQLCLQYYPHLEFTLEIAQ